MADNSTCAVDVCQHVINPDITGIGVRLSFYLQNTLSVILVTRSWKDAPGALWTSIATSAAYTIAAIYSARWQLLSFYQALQVINLTWFANFGTFLALASYARARLLHEEVKDPTHTKERRRCLRHLPSGDTILKLAAMVQTTLSMALTIVAWSRPNLFPSQGQCGDDSTTTCTPPEVKYVFFFAQLPAHGSGRDVGLVFSGISLLCYIFLTVYELYVDAQRRKKRHQQRDRDYVIVNREDVEGSACESFDKEDDSARRRKTVMSDSATAGSSSRSLAIRMQTLDGSDASELGYGGVYASSPGPHTLSSSPYLSPPPMRRHGQAPTSHPVPPPAQHIPPPSTNRNRPLPATPGSSALSAYFPPLDQGFSIRPQPASPARPDKHMTEPAEHVDPMFIGILIVQLVLFVYFVANTELLLTVNPSTGGNALSFGQVFAPVLVVPSLFSVITAFLETGVAPTHKSSKAVESAKRRHKHDSITKASASETEGLMSSTSPDTPRPEVSQRPVDRRLQSMPQFIISG